MPEPEKYTLHGPQGQIETTNSPTVAVRRRAQGWRVEDAQTESPDVPAGGATKEHTPRPTEQREGTRQQGKPRPPQSPISQPKQS